MSAEDCVLAATGGSPLTPALLIVAVAAVAVGIVLVVAPRRRSRSRMTGGGLVVLALAAALTLAPAHSASATSVAASPASAASEACADPGTSNPVAPDPVDPASPPDLTPAIVVPADPIPYAPSSPRSVVVTIRNIGAAATSGQISVRFFAAPPSNFDFAFDASTTVAVVDGTSYPVQNVAWTVTAGAADYTLTTSEVLAAGGSLSFAFTVVENAGNFGDPSSVTAAVAAGTGGGETPTDNNAAVGSLEAGGDEPVTCPPSDKSSTLDSDGDGVVDACDLDSDNDGILDAEEDVNRDGLLEDDDIDGDNLFVPVIGDGVSSYLDLDSENDGVLDLMEGRPFGSAQIDQFDADHNGVFDASLSFGANGLLDAIETSPDSGVLLPALAALRDADGDGTPDCRDLTSNGSDFDLYLIGRFDADLLGGGFISQISDADRDGIQAVVDTDPTTRGAPASPLSPNG